MTIGTAHTDQPRNGAWNTSVNAITAGYPRNQYAERRLYCFVVGLAVIEGAKPPSAHGDAVRMVSGTDGPALSAASAEGASREGRQRPHVLVSCESAPLLSLRSKVKVRCSPRFRRGSHATISVHRRLWSSVQPVGVGHSEPPVTGSRLRSLEPSAERQQRSAGPHETLRVLWTLWDLFLHVPTQKQDAPSATSEGRGGPSAGGRSSSQAFETSFQQIADAAEARYRRGNSHAGCLVRGIHRAIVGLVVA